MITAALTVPVAALGFDLRRTDNVVWFPDGIQRRAAARLGNAGNSGTGSRPPGKPGGRVVLWPVRFWPQRQQDADNAIIQAWRLHSAGIISELDVMVRHAELDAMRRWIQ